MLCICHLFVTASSPSLVLSTYHSHYRATLIPTAAMDLVNRERADLRREAKEALPTAAMEAITLTLENPARAVHRRVARRDMAAIHLSAIHMATVEESREREARRQLREVRAEITTTIKNNCHDYVHRGRRGFDYREEKHLATILTMDGVSMYVPRLVLVLS